MSRHSLPSILSRAAAIGALLVAVRCANEEGPTLPKTGPSALALPAALTGDVLVGAGNIARCDKTNDEATAAIIDTIPGTVFTGGDNITASGSAADFTSCYGPSWGRHKARTRPAPGDKDYATAGASGYFGYFGPAAGDPAKGYYSYDLTDWHIVVLNSASSTVSTKANSPQEQWLRADLAANTKPCVLAYWHNPLFRSTSTPIRTAVKPLWDDLAAVHADIVVNAHLRFYERFAPQNSSEIADPLGIREFIVGTGGGGVDAFSTTVRPNSEVRNSGTYGVLKLTLGAGAYEWRFIPVAGQSFTDSGTGTCHGSVSVASVSVNPDAASVDVGSTVQLTATPRDAAGNPLLGKVVTWQTGDANVATVTTGGIVVGRAEGQATITATSGGQSGYATITVTTPVPGAPVVLVGAGDIASCTSTGDEATAALLDNIPGNVFTAGDNAYDKGSATEFGQCYEPSWGRHKARTRPAPGNHDYGTPGATGYFDYYGTLAGPSGVGYYSYDIGDWHIISLNSNIAMDAGSPQEQWLRADLTANPKRCTLAYWHHPRFSSGTHHGSTLKAQPLWQALYDAGAEIVVSGHEHNYERFAPQTPVGEADPISGIREFVSGTGGASHYATEVALPNSEVFNGTTWGVLKFTLGAGTYSWEFIPIAGQTFTDAGTGTCHGVPSTLNASPASITASTGSSVATITVTARDASGLPLIGVPITITASGTASVVNPSVGVSDGNGVMTAALSSTVAERKIVSATVNGAPVTQTAVVTVNPAAPASLGFIQQPASTAGGVVLSPSPQVEILDAFGNRVVTATNTIAMGIDNNPPGSGFLSGTTSVAAVGGVATFGDLSIDLAGTGYTLRAGSGSLTAAVSSPFDVVGGAVSASLSTVSSQLVSITAGGTSLITVFIRDAAGQPLSNVEVTLTASGGGNSFTPPNPTDATGKTTSTFRSTLAGPKTITAAVGSVVLAQKPVVTVSAGPVDAAASTVIASPTSFMAGAGSSIITVTTNDAFGNPVGSTNVTLSATGIHVTLGTPAGQANGSGVFTSTLSSTDPQIIGVSATANGVPITGAASVTVTPPATVSITQTLLTSGHNPTNGRVFTTAPVSPAPNALVTVAVLTHSSPTVAPTPTVTGGGMSGWAVVGTVTFGGATPLSRLTIYRAMSALPGSGPITITTTVALGNCQWVVSQWDGVDASGTNGSGAIGLTGSALGTAVNGLTVALATLGSPANVGFGVFGVSSNTAVVAPGSGFTAIAQEPSGESTVGDLFAEWAVSRNVINAAWSTKDGGALAVEIKAKP